ncbi:MAG TPA: hypothetical protein VJ739_14010, partial [Gemmataceae bacterium]|nr:hypothetical protein [Gemmataceae bacterium]
MVSEPVQRVARINRGELSHLSPDLSLAERGRRLRRQLLHKGIDPDRLFRVEYYPNHHCWLLTQEGEPTHPRRPAAPASDGKADELYFVSIMAEFQLVARSACARAAAHSTHFARFGCRYQLPEPERELTVADLVEQLGGADGAT